MMSKSYTGKPVKIFSKKLRTFFRLSIITPGFFINFPYDFVIPRENISSPLRNKEMAEIMCIKSMKTVITVGLDMKQSTVLGQ